MIAFFPEPSPDELIYSWLARYTVKAGYLAFRYAAEDLYIHKYTRPDVEFVNALKPEVIKEIEKHCDREKLILEHTMFPAYGRFLPAERKQEASRALAAMHGNFNNLLAIPRKQRGNGRFLRYCPVCTGEDRKTYGEAYWHRKHQIPGIKICGKHGCYLKDSGVSMESKASPGLLDAQSEIPEQEEHEMCKNKREQALAGYLCQVFESRMNLESRMPVSELLKFHLGSYRRSDAGASIHLENLYQDYREFYKGMDTMDQGRMQKILSGSRWNFYEVCQLAMFLGIKAADLVRPSSDLEEQAREPVYVKVSEELQMDYELVRRIGDAVLRHYENRENIRRRKRSQAWDRMDEEMLPEVKKTLKRMYHTGQDRPRRITVSAVQKEMDLPEKRFDKMPLCKAEILRYQESQPEYWAREAVWAYRKLREENETVNWRHIRNLTNMRRIDFQNCKKYLEKYAGKDETGKIEGII